MSGAPSHFETAEDGPDGVPAGNEKGGQMTDEIEGVGRGARFAIDCPHCGERSRVRNSRNLTPLVKAATLQCTNAACGHTFVAQLAITHTLSPAAAPNPAVALPMGRPWRRREDPPAPAASA